MHVYRLGFGMQEHFIAAKDEEDAYKQGTNPDQFPGIHYLPFTISQVTVPGHTVSVTKIKEKPPDEKPKK